MTAKKRTARKKPARATGAGSTADIGMAELFKAEQERAEQERAEQERIWAPYKRKPVIANEASLVATVHQIADIAGAGELSSARVKNCAEFVSSGQLWVGKDGQIHYKLRRPITVGSDLKSDFVISEITDAEMQELGVDGFKVGMLLAQGRHNDVTQDDIRKIARGCIKLPEDFAAQLPARELMALYGLYTVFFLGP